MSNESYVQATPKSQQELKELRKYCIVTPTTLGFQASYYTGRNGENRWRYELPHDENGKRKRIFLAKFIYEQKYGKIKEKEYILHRCGNSLCINIEHLRAGNHAANMRDAVLHGSFEKKIGNISDYLEICRRYKNGEISQSDLGREFNVTQGAIWYIIQKYG